jgi:hypothetical protein
MLLNSRELLLYTAEASDGVVGPIRDLLIDAETWIVRRLVIATGTPSASAQIAAAPVKSIDSAEQTLAFASGRSELTSGSAGDAVAQASSGLRSVADLGGFDVAATDARLGHVHGLMIETATWRARYLVVDTGELLTATEVLLALIAIDNIDWQHRLIRLNMSIDTVRGCPEYDADAELEREYEAFLHDYYGWPPYWL